MSGHLIHIGFPKAASTLLQQWFAEHPQLAYAPLAIGGFGDALDIVAAASRPPADIRYRVTSAEGLSAPFALKRAAFVDYAAGGCPYPERQANACRLLAGLAPGAHVLIVTRGFRSMILSSYSQYARSGGTRSLESLFEGEVDDPWRYDRIAGLYREAFGDERVLVLPQELLRDDPAGFRGAIEAWLGIDPHPLPAGQPNPALSPVEMRWYPRLARLVARLPIGRARHRLLRWHADRAMANRWRGAIALLQRLRPAVPVTGDLIPDAVVERFRGNADTLGRDPRYAPYARDYLFDDRGRSTSAV